MPAVAHLDQQGLEHVQTHVLDREQGESLRQEEVAAIGVEGEQRLAELGAQRLERAAAPRRSRVRRRVSGPPWPPRSMSTARLMATPWVVCSTTSGWPECRARSTAAGRPSSRRGFGYAVPPFPGAKGRRRHAGALDDSRGVVQRRIGIFGRHASSLSPQPIRRIDAL